MNLNPENLALIISGNINNKTLENAIRSYTSNRVVAISFNISKTPIKDDLIFGTYSQADNKVVTMRDGLSGSFKDGDCSKINLYAVSQAKKTSNYLTEQNIVDHEFINLMNPDLFHGIMCQKINWLPDININESFKGRKNETFASTAWTMQIFENYSRHENLPEINPIYGNWTRLAGSINNKENFFDQTYSQAMQACVNSNLNSPNAIDMSKIPCQDSAVRSAMDFQHIAGKPLMGNWVFGYEEFYADMSDYMNTKNEQSD